MLIKFLLMLLIIILCVYFIIQVLIIKRDFKRDITHSFIKWPDPPSRADPSAFHKAADIFIKNLKQKK
jgi:hypothetical protein